VRWAFLAAFSGLVAVASACSSISLSADSAAAPAAGSSSGGLGGGDAGGGGALTFGASDAATTNVAPTVLENPLCNLRVDGEDGGSLQCSVPDAGAPLVDVDAAVVAQHADAGDDDDSGKASADAGAPPVDANPPPYTGTPACHVAGPDAGGLQVCSAPGAGKDGDECQAGDDCANGYECVGSPGQCRHYCCAGNAVCDGTHAPSFCNPEPVVSGAFRVPVCIPVSGCSLFGSVCSPGQTCAVVKEDGTTSCVPIGPQVAGAECDTADCASGLTCIGDVGARTCYQLCHVAWTSECPPGTTCTGSAQLFQDPSFGICR
jgi:hypothetical protein